MKRAAAILREAWFSALSQPVSSALTLLMVAGMVLTVMLTTGRTVAAEHAVLSTIDDAGTRTIQVRADEKAGLTSDVLGRLSAIEGIEWAGAFTLAVDATNALVPDGTRSPVRFAYSNDFARFGIPAHPALPDQMAYASAQAMDEFGLVGRSGAVTLVTGESLGIAGPFDVPDFLSELEPLTIVPTRDPTGDRSVNLLLVVAETPQQVAPVADAVLSLLAVEDPSRITVETSEQLAELRGLVQSELGTFSRGLVLALLAVTAALVAVILYGLVMLRRRDFGRRRALGATRLFVVSLLMTQTGILTLIGSVLGMSVAVLLLLVSHSALPGVEFTAAVMVLAIVAGLVASVIPAVVASRREPIRELRVA